MLVLKRIAFLCMAASTAFRPGPAQAGDGVCFEAHETALRLCSNHEHTPSANTLTIVSKETRDRVIDAQSSRLEVIQRRCLRAQRKCYTQCASVMESALADGANVGPAIDKLQECEQGEVIEHLKKIAQKIEKLRNLRQASND